jgi:hypothetical protein
MPRAAVAFEAAGNYDRPPAHFLMSEGFIWSWFRRWLSTLAVQSKLYC